MEIKYSEKEISFEREITNLDRFVFNFIKILDKFNIKYTIISDYIAILFGRSRNTEDVDMFVDKINKDIFKELWQELKKQNFWCINSDDIDDVYELILEGSGIRFAIKDRIEPNMELKFPKSNLDVYSLNNRVRVNINEKSIYTSPLETQIAFKMYLGSDKDIEDARHLWILFKEHLIIEKLKYFADQLLVNKEIFQNVTR